VLEIDQPDAGLAQKVLPASEKRCPTLVGGRKVAEYVAEFRPT
jgi:hypothetical protein